MLLKTWNTISEFGLSDKHPEENNLIRIFNQLMFISSIAAFGLSIGAVLFDLTPTYQLMPFSAALFYAFGVILNYFKKIYLVRYLIVLGAPVLLCGIHVCIGGHFGQDTPIITCSVAAILGFHYNKRIYIPCIIFIFTVYVLSMLYVSLQGPIFGEINKPIDEIVVTMACTTWLIGLLFLFKHEKADLILTLSEKNEQLEETTLDLERFTYAASHDLKSPVNSIKGWITMLERDLANGNVEAASKKLEIIKGSNDQMGSLVDGILELAKVKDLKNAKSDLIPLNKIIEKVKINLHHYSEEKNAIITHTPLPDFYCNETAISILLQNFIQNGIKYNESVRPKVHVDFQMTDDQLTLIFTDNGIGIDQKHHQQIFQFFGRLHSNATYKGTGIGLGMCKKIIDAYDGQIEIESRLGEGTSFRICFPIRNKTAPSTQIIEEVLY